MPLNAAIVGVSTTPAVHTIDARWLMAYAAGLGEMLPCYLDTRRPAGIQAHPLFPVCVEWPAVLALRERAYVWSRSTGARPRQSTPIYSPKS